MSLTGPGATGSPELLNIMRALDRSNMFKAAAAATDAAEMVAGDPGDQAPPPSPEDGAPMTADGMPPGPPQEPAIGQGGTLSDQLRERSDSTPDMSEKQMLLTTADRLDQLNAPIVPEEEAAPEDNSQQQEAMNQMGQEPEPNPMMQAGVGPGALPNEVAQPKTAAVADAAGDDFAEIVQSSTTDGVDGEKYADDLSDTGYLGWLRS